MAASNGSGARETVRDVLERDPSLPPPGPWESLEKRGLVEPPELPGAALQGQIPPARGQREGHGRDEEHAEQRRVGPVPHALARAVAQQEAPQGLVPVGEWQRERQR